MVVLDGHSMLGAGPNQYLQPDYLSALPITLDAKKSPLALLAQTCSQIGADSPNTKSLLPSSSSSSSIDSSKRKSSTSSETSSLNCAETSNNLIKCERDTSSRPRSSGNHSNNNNTNSTKSTTQSSNSSTTALGKSSSPAFKPYESSTSSSSTSSKLKADSSPKSETNHHLQQQQHHHEKGKGSSKRPASSSPHDSSPINSAKSARRSPNTPSSNHHSNSAPSLMNGNGNGGSEKNHSSSSSSESSGKTSPKTNNNNNSNSSSSGNSDRGASPIIRSGLEVLHGHGLSGKDGFGKPGSSALSSLSALAAHYPPGFDPTNPAMRPAFFAPPSAHHLFAAGYPQSIMQAPGGSPYVSYTRVKTPSGAETIVPVCKDPYCTGCSLSLQGLMANAAVAAAAAGFPGFGPPPGSNASGGICPAGCVQCDHQKFAIGLPPFMSGLGLPPTSTAYQSSFLSQAQAQAAAAQHQQQNSQRPYVCNWIVGESYCGKRFPSSEELLQHLRTHTNLSTSEASSISAMNSAAASSLYSNALLNSSMGAAAAAAAAMHRTYPTPPLSPLSAARYHPYAQAAAAAAAAAGKSGMGLGHPSLANYYQNMSPYALYGQRIGPPVHQ